MMKHYAITGKRCSGYALVRGAVLALLLNVTVVLSKELPLLGVGNVIDAISNNDNSLTEITRHIENLDRSISYIEQMRKDNGRTIREAFSPLGNDSVYEVITSRDTLADGILNVITFIENLDRIDQRSIAYLRLINVIAETDDTVVTQSFLTLMTTAYKLSNQGNSDDFYKALYSADELSPGEKALFYVLLYSKTFNESSVDSTVVALALKLRDFFVCCHSIMRGYLISMFQDGMPGSVKVLMEDRPYTIENVQNVGFKLQVVDGSIDVQPYNKWKWNITLVDSGYVVLENWNGLKLCSVGVPSAIHQTAAGAKSAVGTEGHWMIIPLLSGALFAFENRENQLILDSNKLLKDGTANVYSEVYVYAHKDSVELANPYIQWHIY